MTRRLLTVLAACLIVVLGGGSALAAWSSLVQGSGAATAGIIPKGPAAAASPAGGDVDISWDAVSLSGGHTASYVVKRYSATGVRSTPNSGCAASTTSTHCTESSTPEGRWTYTVAAERGGWRGAEGAASSAIHIATHAPSALAQAAGATRTSVTLNWTDNSSIEDGYSLQRSDDGTSGWADLGPVQQAGTTSYSDTTITCGQTKSYRVKATSAGNDDSVYSATATATAAACPQSEATPTGLRATAVSATRVDLSWTDNATGESGYRIEFSADGSSWSALGNSLPANTTSFSDTSL